MGETADYERMMNELREEQLKEAQARLDTIEASEIEKEAAHAAACAQHGIQDNSPFRLKDIVLHVSTAREGKVIGLPLKTYVGRYDVEDHAYQAWVHFSDGSRAWLGWAELKELRRSPPREKRPAAMSANAATEKKTVQQKLFAASRSEFQRAGEEASTDMPEPAAHERDRVLPHLPPAGVRGRQKQAS